MISLWLYKENNKLRDWNTVFTLHIPSWAPYIYDFVVLTSLSHPRKILLVVLQVGKSKDLSAPLRVSRCTFRDFVWLDILIVENVNMYQHFGTIFCLFYVYYLTTLPVPKLYRVDERMINKHGMINECGAVCGMRAGRGNWNTRRKRAPVPLRPLQIPYDLTWDRNPAAAVGSRRLIAWAMGWPMFPSLLTHTDTHRQGKALLIGTCETTDGLVRP
jgi:hypothetical protein